MSQQTLFFDEELAVEELKNRGYRVVKVGHPKFPGLKNINELVQFFYARRRFYNPDRQYPESLDYENDRKYIASLVKARQEAGLNKKLAMHEAADIIDALFKYEKLLVLDYPVSGANILGSNFIVNRLCSFLNGEVPEAKEVENDLAIDQWNEYYNKKHAAEDLEKAKEKMKIMLEKLDEQK